MRELLRYQTNSGDVDLSNEAGTAFWNVCWSLTDPGTVRREQRAMGLGRSGARARKARGVLLGREFDAAWKPALPEAQPAWRWLLESTGQTG